MTTTTETATCPKCQGPMWDEKKGKFWKPGRPIYKCRDKECGGVIWEPKQNGAAKPSTEKKPYTAGPYVPAIDGDENPYAQGEPQVGEPPAKAMLSLYRDCFHEALRMVKALNDDPKTPLEFTGDNVCAIAATLYIESNKRGIRSLAA